MKPLNFQLLPAGIASITSQRDGAAGLPAACVQQLESLRFSCSSLAPLGKVCKK